MRNPNRIPEILALIEQIWQQDPDLRFNQLIYNLQCSYSQQNGGMGKVEEIVDKDFSRIGYDLYNLADSAFEKFLRKQVASK